MAGSSHIIIVDYGMGNLGSIFNMLKHLGVSSKVSGDPAEVQKADKLILSGVGAFDNGMKNLREKGLIDILNTKVLKDRTPVLGICLGMQLLTQRSEEGQLPGLGWVNAQTVRFHFTQKDPALKIPHMGWNVVQVKKPGLLFSATGEENRFYFVHSYHLECQDPADVIGETWHGYNFPSVIEKGNICGVQFHPEKSHKFGMTLLRKFAGN